MSLGAGIVTVSPGVPPVADMVGVLSLVLLSVLDDPVSDPLALSLIYFGRGRGSYALSYRVWLFQVDTCHSV